MGKNHVDTWQLWLEKISPLGGSSLRLLSEMAQALSLAAPGGPVGFECVDECRCDERAIHTLHQALMDHRHPMALRVETTETLLQELRRALQIDQAKRNNRMCVDDATMRDIAEWEVIVSRHTARVSYARQLFPTLWATIEAHARHTQ